MSEETCTCRGCGRPMAPGLNPGRPKIWCSARCRAWVARHPNSLRPTGRICRHCGIDIDDLQAAALFCSLRCSEMESGRRLAQPHPERFCVECGELYQPRDVKQRYCSGSCKTRYVSGVRGRGRSARGRGSRVVELFKPVEIFERDRWKCGICRRRIDRRLAWPHPKCASIDHVIPISKGGDHTRANVRATHLGCNVQRKDRCGGEQLALVG